MVLQAAIDDSGNAPDQHTFVLAGFLSTAERWAAFADEWDAELKRAPSLDYFKFKEACGLKDQFDPNKGWTVELCEQRVESLASIIRKHVIARVHAVIQHAHFQAFFRSVPVPSRKLLSDHPYQIVLGRLVPVIAQAIVDLKLREECDVYLDSQDGFDAEVLRLWPFMRDSLAGAPAHVLNGEPPPRFETVTFRSEETFLPLQAADMLAGAVRDATMNGSMIADVAPLQEIRSWHFEFTEEEVRRVGKNLAAFVAKNHPGPLVPYDRNAARRQRKKQRRDERRGS